MGKNYPMPNPLSLTKELPLIFIVGPSAAGKSEIALSLAQRLDAEIVCCDAMQVYREIDIASDKPAVKALELVPHHLLNIVSVTEEFNVARYRELALLSINDILARGRVPVITGGSGMYMSVLLDGIFENTPGEDHLREELTRELKAGGPNHLHERLRTLDPKAAAKIHPNDAQRVIRALQVVLSSGQLFSRLQEKRQGLWGRLPIKIFALNRPRQELYQRAEARIDKMFAGGLVDEITKIKKFPLSKTAGKIIGIPEVMGHLDGQYDTKRAGYLMKLNTRHYIKRQLTWFRRDKRLTWIEMTNGQPAGQVTDIILAHVFS